jgi:transcriptional regulator with XRE-family HTH domain
MSTSLSKQISARMRAKNLSVGTLEREAGLKTHAVQNILRGKSKNPSAKLLQSVADVLGCTVKELLESHEIFEDDESSDSKMEALNSPYVYSNLLVDTAQLIHEKLKKKKAKVTNQQVLASIEEIFSYSLQKDPSHIDQDFADWYIDLITD